MRFAVATVAAALLLGGCSLPTFFRVPVLQGNVVEQDKVEQLEPGMTPRQVRYLLGTPLVRGAFGEQRWDYVFYFRDQNANVRESRLSLFFQGGRLDRIEGDESYQALLPEEAGDVDPDEVQEGPRVRPTTTGPNRG